MGPGRTPTPIPRGARRTAPPPGQTGDHVVSQSLYFTDPDGHVLECYVDADPAIWRQNPQAVATTRPLAL